jgi:hypothetical protein
MSSPPTDRRDDITLPHKATPERLTAFSDAVFAVLITVIALDLRPPEAPIFEALLPLWPTWLSSQLSVYSDRLDQSSLSLSLCVANHCSSAMVQFCAAVFNVHVAVLYRMDGGEQTWVATGLLLCDGICLGKPDLHRPDLGAH